MYKILYMFPCLVTLLKGFVLLQIPRAAYMHDSARTLRSHVTGVLTRVLRFIVVCSSELLYKILNTTNYMRYLVTYNGLSTWYVVEWISSIANSSGSRCAQTLRGTLSTTCGILTLLRALLALHVPSWSEVHWHQNKVLVLNEWCSDFYPLQSQVACCHVLMV